MPIRAPNISVIDICTIQNRISDVAYHDADITFSFQVAYIFQSISSTTIIHTVSPTANSPDRALYKKVNVEETRNLLSAARATHVKKAFIYTSSASVIHDHICDIDNGDETLPATQSLEQIQPLATQKELPSHLF